MGVFFLIEVLAISFLFWMVDEGAPVSLMTILIVHILVLLSAGTLLLYLFLLKPLERFRHEVEAMSQGKKKWVLLESHDEIGLLAKSINVWAETLRDRERELQLLKNEFLSKMSHELRTPLTSLKSSVALLTDKIPGDLNHKQERCLEIAHHSIDRLALLVEDLLKLSNLEADQVRVSKEPVNIYSLMGDVIQGLAPWVRLQQIQIKNNLAANLPYLYGDRAMLYDAFIKLGHNATKWSPAGGTITFSADVDHDAVRFCIQDEGVGIDPVHFDRLFEKFDQIDRSQGPGYQGAGVGLALCKDIIELHEGKMWVESERHKGSRFYFTIPLYEATRDFNQSLKVAMIRAEREHKPLSLVVMSIPHLNKMKDEFGEEIVWRVIEDLEKKLRNVLRGTDKIFHYTQKEMVAVMARTGREGAEKVRVRILREIKDWSYPVEGKRLKPEIRVGWSTYPSEATEPTALINNALQSVTVSS